MGAGVSTGVRQALLLILHGSPRPDANEPALQIAQQLREDSRFDYIAVAYLECNEPSICDAVDECAAAGAEELIAVPYFLHTGRHQVLDVPRLLLEGAARNPGLTILMTDPVGTSPVISMALAGRAGEAGDGA